VLNLSINGELTDIESPLTLAELLEYKGYARQKVAVAINGEFVPRSCYGETVIDDSDNIDIVRAVGGG